MNNADFWASIRSIIAEGFTPEGLHKLDYYAEQFISGRLVYQRFSPREQYGCSASGETNVIASLLAGAEDCSDSDVAETLSELQRMRYDSVQKKSRVACQIQIFFVPLPLISHRGQMAMCSDFVVKGKGMTLKTIITTFLLSLVLVGANGQSLAGRVYFGEDIMNQGKEIVYR